MFYSNVNLYDKCNKRILIIYYTVGKISTGRSKVDNDQFLIWRYVAFGYAPRTPQRLSVLCYAASTLQRL